MSRVGKQKPNFAAYQVSKNALHQWEIFNNLDEELLQEIQFFYIFHSQPFSGCGGGIATFIITVNDEVLGLGHNCSKINILGFAEGQNYKKNEIHRPTKINSLSHRHIIGMSVGTLVGAAVTQCGTLYWWGQCENEMDCIATPHTPLVKGRKFINVACGYKFMAAVSECRNVYIWGQAEETGKYFEAELLNIRFDVVYISCGLHHIAALCANGSIYTWGRGMDGQRGLDALAYDDMYRPKKINADPCITVKCGPLSTFCVTTFNEVKGCGTNHHLYMGILDNIQVVQNLSRIILNEPVVDLIAVWGPDDLANIAAITSTGGIHTWGIRKYPTPCPSNSLNDVFSYWRYTPGLVRIRQRGPNIPITSSSALVKPLNIAELLKYLYVKDRLDLVPNNQQSLSPQHLDSVPKELTSRQNGKGYILNKFLTDVFHEEQIPPTLDDIMNQVKCMQF